MADPRPYSLAWKSGPTYWFFEPTDEPAPVHWDDIVGKPSLFPPESHDHTTGDITWLTAMFESDFDSVADLQGSSTMAGFVWVNITRDDGVQEGAMFRRSGAGVHDGVNVIQRYDGIIYTRCQ